MTRSVGAVLVIDAMKARTDAAHSVITRFPVGCGPVRLVLTPDDRTAWVSLRADNTLMALDTRKLVADSAHAIVTRLKVGTAPVGLAVYNDGRTVIATNSNRFAGDANDKQSLNVVDASNGAATARVAREIPAGAFPRELRITPDGRTLLASNFASKTLQVVDLQRVSLKPAP
jgi:DNA-binding beta-propeller fold protein YncE